MENMDEKKNTKKKILHWVLLIAIACVLALIVLLILMLPIIKGDVYYTKEGRQTRQAMEEDIPNTPKFPDDPEAEPPTCILVELKNEDIFDKGYYEYYFDIFTSGVAYIGSNNDPGSDIEWKVYISDIKLTEKEIYALEENEPVAINKGEVEIERGQWIYVLCNVNAQTAQSPSDSMFGITSFRSYA